MENTIKIITVILTGFGAMLGLLQFVLGYKPRVKAITLNNIQMITNLKYNSDTGKTDLLNSEIYKGLTGTTAWIHHINLMFNAPDPGRLIEIYRRFPVLVSFGDNSIIVPKIIRNPILRLLYLLGIILMIIYPFGSWIYLINELNTSKTNHALLTSSIVFALLLPMTIKGISSLSFLLEVHNYYSQCFNVNFKKNWKNLFLKSRELGTS